MDWPGRGPWAPRAASPRRWITTLVVDQRSAVLLHRSTSPPPPLFRDTDPATIGLHHVHEENPYDDFQLEVLLPHKMSELAPSWPPPM